MVDESSGKFDEAAGHGIRVECRKCGAILPGPVEICPICYAEQSREDARTKGTYKPYLLIGFLIAAVVLVLILMAKG